MRRLVCLQPIILLTGLASALLLTGCAMPSQVRAPRTLEAGRAEHTVGLQLGTINQRMVHDVDDHEGIPSLTPTYAFRVGLLEWLEFGARASLAPVPVINFGFASGLELTAQLLEGRHLDLAIGADIGWLPLPVRPSRWDVRTRDESRIVASLPLLLGVNLHRDLTLIGLAAPVYSADAAHLQFGGGMEIRTIPGIRFRPHVSYLSPAPFDSVRRRHILESERDYHPFFIVGLDLALGGDRGYGSTGIF